MEEVSDRLREPYRSTEDKIISDTQDQDRSRVFPVTFGNQLHLAASGGMRAA
jgi:hypothetical protein